MWINKEKYEKSVLASSNKMMQFRKISDLNTLSTNNIHKFASFDLIVGVPRSGLLCATLISTQINAPMVSFEAFIAGNLSQAHTGRISNKHLRLAAGKGTLNVLIVDDSISSGTAHARVRNLVVEAGLDKKYNIKYLAFLSCSYSPRVDYVLDVVDHPRVFEWNYLHHEYATDYCVDLDGVLCVDPSPNVNDDGEKYKDFILNAPLRLNPTKGVGAIVTSRLEKYRPETEQWLVTKNIRYRYLVMLDLPSAAERIRLKAHAPYKAEVYSHLGGKLFVESEDWQAKEIARLTKRPVYCVESSMFYSGT